MSIITSPATLLPHQLRQYLAKLDELGLVYHLTVAEVKSYIKLELLVDSADVGLTITLHPAGGWSAEGTLVVGEKFST